MSKKSKKSKATTKTKVRKIQVVGEPENAPGTADADGADTAPQGAPDVAPPGPTDAAADPGANVAPPGKARRTRAAKPERPPRETDPRMPPLGTVLQKRDRHGNVRCECTVEADGIRYAGTLHRSLSGAAMAAARDLGLTNKTQNGWVFWGVTKVPRPAGDPLESLARAWERYRERVAAAAKIDGELRVRAAETIQAHVVALTGLAAEVTA